MLTIKRRHTKTCPIKGNRALNKCTCPLWAFGVVNGKRVRKALDTINIEIATRRARQLEEEIETGKVRKSVDECASAFLAAKQDIAPASFRKYDRILRRFAEYARTAGVATLDRFSLEDLDGYRNSRPLCALSWAKELQLLRDYFKFAVRRKWCAENIAKDMSMPSNPKPKPREPYTSDEIANIFAAAESIGRGPYERLRARAIVLLMHFYGLRISDVATLKRDRIENGQLFLHALKNGALIWLPLYDEVRDALEALPQPKGASGAVDYFFWTGNGSIDSLLRGVERTLTAVFRKSKVKGATAHRFRHTLCTRILVNGGTIEDAANVLGDSPAVIRKHYAKYCPEYQHRTISLMNRVHNAQSGTPQTHEKNRGVSPVFSSLGVVAREGIEPPTHGFSVRCSTN